MLCATAAAPAGTVFASSNESGFGATEGTRRSLTDQNKLNSTAAFGIRERFRNKHIVMIGDSLMRYQYLSLAYWIEHGKQPGDGLGSVAKHSKSICSEWSWPGGKQENKIKWKAFYQDTNSMLRQEKCDCYRDKLSWSHPTENRFVYHLMEAIFVLFDAVVADTIGRRNTTSV